MSKFMGLWLVVGFVLASFWSLIITGMGWHFPPYVNFLVGALAVTPISFFITSLIIKERFE